MPDARLQHGGRNGRPLDGTAGDRVREPDASNARVRSELAGGCVQFGGHHDGGALSCDSTNRTGFLQAQDCGMGICSARRRFTSACPEAPRATRPISEAHLPLQIRSCWPRESIPTTAARRLSTTSRDTAAPFFRLDRSPGWPRCWWTRTSPGLHTMLWTGFYMTKWFWTDFNRSMYDDFFRFFLCCRRRNSSLRSR